MATFGRSTVGSTTDSYADQKQVHPVTAIAGNVTKLTALLDGGSFANTFSQKARGVLYADNAGAPGNLLGVTNEITVVGGAAAAWIDLVFPTPVAVTAVQVWMGMWLGSGTQVIRHYCDPAGGDKYNANTYSSTSSPTSPFGTPSTTAGHSNPSLYATTASAPTFVAEAHGDSGGSAATLTVTKPTGVASSHCMVVAVQASTNAARGLTSPGWSLLLGQLAGTAFGSMWVFYKTAGAAEPTSYTFTLTGGNQVMAYSILAYSGTDPTDPTEAYAAANAAAAASATTPTLTTTGANRTIVSFFAKDGAAGPMSWSSTGATERTDYMEATSFVSISAYEELKATAGTVSRTATEGSGNATNNSRETQTAIVSLAATATPSASGSGVFGRQDVGAAPESNATDTIELDQRTAIAGQINKATAYLSGSGVAGSQNVRVVLYADNLGSPGAFLAATSQVTVVQNQAGAWVDLPFPTPPTVNAGAIWAGLWWGGATNSVAQVAADGAGGSPYMTGATYNSTGNGPATFTTTGTTASHTNLSINLTVGSGTGSNTEITFGSSPGTVGASWQSLTGNFKGVSGPFRPPNDGQVSQMRYYLRGQATAQAMRAVLYADASGVPGALVGVTTEVTVAVNQAAGWITFSFPSSLSVSATTQYWLGLWVGAAGTPAQVAFDALLTSRNNANTYSSSANPSDPYGTASSQVMEMSGYAVMSSTVGVPANTVKPLVTGTPAQGQTLSVSNGTWTGTPTSYAYQWKRAGVPITGATASSYTVVSADVGSALIATVTATNGSGSGSVDSDPTAVVTAASGTITNTVAPVVSGAPNVGNTLTCTTGSWTGSPSSFTYAWYRSSSATGATGWSAIVGATANTYVVQSGDVTFFSGAPAYFSCVVTANA